VKVSVIIPVYNGERHLRAALESVFAQTYPLHEIVTVDDGSTDSSPEILRSYGDRLTVIRQDNQGVAVARNTGLSHATGDAIAFLDQDDLWPADRTQILVEALDSDPEAEVIVGLAAVRYERTSPPAYRWEVETTHREYLLGSQIIRARVFDALGKLNTNVGYADDTDFLFHRLEHKMKAGRLDEVTLIYRMHDNNTSFPRDPSRSHMLSALRAHLWRVRATQ
jgi:glycosyltransferase involved in cell wall biosynthesis